MPRTGTIASPSPSGSIGVRIDVGSRLRKRGDPFRSPQPRGLYKVAVLVPKECADAVRRFARELRARRWSEASPRNREWRKLSLSAELFTDPECRARCAVRDTRAAGPDRYLWSVTVSWDTDPVAEGRTAELAEARQQAEAALKKRRSGAR